MRFIPPHEQPQPWSEERQRARHRWTVPFIGLEWCFDWVAYFLSRWKLLEVLEYLGSLSILVAAIFYFSESGDRVKQKHYQAWQVINTAQGKGGSGGRLEALQELNADHVPLVGVDVSGAYLQDVRLPKSSLLRANFSAVDARNSDFRRADFSDANLRGGNFRYANFSKASLKRTELQDSDLVGANFSGADLTGASLSNADLRQANLAGAIWKDLAEIKGANIAGVENAPEGFRAWGLKNGAIETDESK
ncbi:MAG TPA: pentapeptide repeat-containing protein [Candidatus Acidoferrales bacterium]